MREVVNTKELYGSAVSKKDMNIVIKGKMHARMLKVKTDSSEDFFIVIPHYELSC